MKHLEPMTEFFAVRADGYDEHMYKNVEGCREGYEKMSTLIPSGTKSLLDLGCGTGLELDRISERLPDLEVTGIDLSQAMLDKLLIKHANRSIRLICGDYFSVSFGEKCFDCAVSFQTMHHFSHDKKRGLYQKIRSALVDGGCYIECDYMVGRQEEEDCLFAENARLRWEQGIAEDAYYHFDTPCTVENQIALLKSAGFAKVEQVFRIGNTTMLTAKK